MPIESKYSIAETSAGETVLSKDGTDLGHGPLLQCTSLKPQMTKCFAEARIA